MIVTVGLSPEDAQKKFDIGDIIQVQILIDEKIGEVSDVWKFGADQKEKWFISSGLVVNKESLHCILTENNLTKLQFTALVHAPGIVEVGPINIVHQPSSKEFLVKGEVIHEVAAVQENQQEKPDEGWMLPAIDFGHWNKPLVILAILILLAAIFFLLKKIYGYIPFLHQRLTHKEKAIRALQSLQGFARRSRTLQLDDWKKFSFELANILRNFNDENFHIDSKDLTDRELLEELTLHQLRPENRDALAEILSTINEVRYGRKELNITLVPSLIIDAQKFVEKTYIDPNQPKQGKKK